MGAVAVVVGGIGVVVDKVPAGHKIRLPQVFEGLFDTGIENGYHRIGSAGQVPGLQHADAGHVPLVGVKHRIVGRHAGIGIGILLCIDDTGLILQLVQYGRRVPVLVDHKFAFLVTVFLFGQPVPVRDGLLLGIGQGSGEFHNDLIRHKAGFAFVLVNGFLVYPEGENQAKA
jgi:hypothetical protein